MDQLEKRFGRFAIPDLTVKFLFLQAIGYVLFEMLKLDGMRTYCEMNPYMILHHFQIWRLVTWLMIPTDGGLFLFIITAVFFYLPIGRQLEQTWGEFRYTFYLFLGFFFTVLGGFIVYGITGGMAITMDQGVLVKATGEVARRAMENGTAYDQIGAMITPFYVMMSIFFAFAATYPEEMVLFMFLIPVKMKWLALLDGAFMVYRIFIGAGNGDYAEVITIVMSLLNFVIYWFLSRNDSFKRYRPKEVKRRREFQNMVKMTPPGIALHKCAICGKTSLEYPDMDFRFCSKCNGNYEYCPEHLFTHTHVK